MRKQLSNRNTLTYSILSMITVFLIDLLIPLGTAIGVLYVISIIFLTGGSKRSILTVSIIATILILMVLLMTITPETTWMVYVNRGISVITIWFVAPIIIKQNFHLKTRRYAEELKKKNEEILKQRETLYALIDNIPLYIGIYDKDGCYTMVNKNYEQAFYMKRDEIIGKKLEDIITARNMKVYGPMLERALNGEEVEFHRKTQMKDGSVIMANGKYIPVFDDNGEVNSVTVTLSDVSKLEKIRSELEQANHAKNRLLGIVSHDIRGPLANFESLLKVSSSKIIGKEEFEKLINDLQRKFHPIQKMVNDLLEWSRMQLEEMVPKPTKINVKLILDDLLAILEPNLNGKNIQLQADIDLDSVYADIDHLKIILRNILHNAVKFTPESGNIDVICRKSDSFGIVEISDSGAGMSKKIIDNILKGNIVESSIGTIGEKGTGLGLNACVELVRKNKGEIAIDSDHPSPGTKVTVKLRINN